MLVKKKERKSEKRKSIIYIFNEITKRKKEIHSNRYTKNIRKNAKAKVKRIKGIRLMI